jgi:hypothetical protein
MVEETEGDARILAARCDITIFQSGGDFSIRFDASPVLTFKESPVFVRLRFAQPHKNRRPV